MYLDTAVDSILKGLDEQLFCMRVNILDAALSVLVVLVLLPRVGIYGYIIEIFACELINASLSVMRLMQVMEVKLSPWIAVKPLLAVFGATVLSRFLFAWILPVAMNGMGLFLHIAMIALLYVGLLYLPQLMGHLWKSARVRLHPRKTAATMGECAIR